MGVSLPSVRNLSLSLLCGGIDWPHLLNCGL